MERIRKIYAIILTSFFLCWISLPILNEPFQFYKEPKISKNENRNLARKPQFIPELLDPYPVAYESYFNDHFLFRPQIFSFNTLFNYFLLHRSPAPEDVAVGKEGWFYLAQKEKQVYTGTYMLSNSQLVNIAKELKRRATLLEQRGIKFYVTFAPMKQDIYPEYLPPDYYHCPTGTVTEKIIATIRKFGGVNLIDLEKPLMDAKKYGRLYNKTDNHWNMFGAYYAYREIAKRIHEDFPSFNIVENSDVYFRDTILPSGNLAIMSDLADYLKEVHPMEFLRHPHAKTGQKVGYKQPYNGHEDSFELVKETNDPKLPKALVIRDSFTNAMIPYLDEGFQRSVFIFDLWKYQDNEPIVENEKPDLVLLVIYEPHISNLIQAP